MVWHVHAAIGQEIQHFTMDERQPSVTPEAGARVTPFAPPSASELGHASGLSFALSGDGPSFDLRVRDIKTGAALTVTATHLTSKIFGHLPNLDAAVVVSGDAGTALSRRMMIVNLGPLRAALAAGRTTMTDGELDYATIQGMVNGIDLDIPSVRVWPMADTREVIVTWNVPRSNPPEACLKAFDFYGYTAGNRLSGSPQSPSKQIKLSDFWLHRCEAARDKAGLLRLAVVGVGRRRRDFCLAVHSMAINLSSTAVYRALSEIPFTQRLVEEVKLRDNDGLKAIAALPQGLGLLLAVEDPLRRKAVVRVDFDENSAAATAAPVEMPFPRELWIDDVAPPAAEPTPEDLDGEGLDEGRVAVRPGGTRVSLGAHAADSEVWAQVYILGDGEGAGLRWWLSQSGDKGEVDFTLHLDADREVQVRYLLFEG